MCNLCITRHKTAQLETIENLRDVANLSNSKQRINTMSVYCNRLKPNKDGVVGEGLRFERIRRITGYLVGTIDRFNNAKRAEVNERVKHLSVK